MYTVENLFHFLHQLSAIVWLGGILALNVLQVRLGNEQDRAAQKSLLRHSDLYGRAVIGPAAVVALLTGLVLVAQIDVPLSTFWVVWGLAGLFLSLALGGTLIRATKAELRRLTAEPTIDNPRWLARRRRAAILYAVNLLLLLSVLWAMVFKPTL
jgi:putative copper export protein